MVYLVIVLGGSYVALLVVAAAGWARAMAAPLPAKVNTELVTVIVPARNEAHRLRTLLNDLALQRHASFEVIVVDDHSQDDTYSIAAEYQHADERFHVVHGLGEGKKQAIAEAVARARGTIVVTTDADCRVPPGWLETISAEFYDASVQLVFGGVRMASHNFFASMQAIEFSSLIGSGAAAAALQHPIMCNGANLAYRKAAFEAVNGYEGNAHIASGDDEFLLRKIAAKFPRSIRFAHGRGAVVSTLPCGTLRELAQQRLRWAGKWRHNGSVLARAMAVYVLLVQLLVLACAGFLFVATGPLQIAAAIFLCVKLLLEAAFLTMVARRLEIRWNWLAFMSLQIVYPFYIVLTGLLSLAAPTHWKGRRV